MHQPRPISTSSFTAHIIHTLFMRVSKVQFQEYCLQVYEDVTKDTRKMNNTNLPSGLSPPNSIVYLDGQYIRDGHNEANKSQTVRQRYLVLFTIQ